jgi:disulfide oxidoreductase YuzD
VIEGNTGTVTAVFTVTLSAVSGVDAVLNYQAANDTAIAPLDYVAASGTITIPAGSITGTINVAVNGELVFEPNETFFVNLSSPIPADVTIADGQAVGTIQNDDLQPTLSIDDPTVAEGNSGTKVMTFTVSLSNPTYVTVTANYQFIDVTATFGVDYTGTGGAVTIPPLGTSAVITATLFGETVFEPDEVFNVQLTSPSGALPSKMTGIGTIQNDDGMPLVTINDVTVQEGGAPVNAVFTVLLSNPSAQPVTVDYASADGSATAPADYTAVAGTVTIPPLGVSGTITVPITSDLVYEAAETFAVNLITATNATIMDAQGVGTINDDEPLPSLTISSEAVGEGDSGTVAMTFTVTQSTPSGATTTVSYATVGGTATGGVDYVAATGTLTITPGLTTTTVTIFVNGDTVYEANETFTVVLSSPNNAQLGSPSQGTGTITDNDPLPAVSIGDVTVAEGNAGTTNAAFAVTLSNASGFTTTVAFAAAAGTAASPSDFAANSGTLAIPPHTITATITVAVIGETTFEADEGFTVTLSNPNGATIGDGVGAGTITNDDAQPAVSIGDAAVTEGNAGTVTATFTVTLATASAFTVTVDFATADGSALAGTDYLTATGTLTFAPGQTVATVTVTVNGDIGFEADETFVVNLSGVAGATLGDGQGQGTIRNDDASGPVPKLYLPGIMGIGTPRTGR